MELDHVDVLTSVEGINELVPRVELKQQKKEIRITGISRRPDPGMFYTKLIEKLKNLFIGFKNNINSEFYFEYLNRGSSKWLYYTLNHLETYLDEGGTIKITWKYDKGDESIKEIGEVLKAQLKIPFTIIAV